MDAGAVGTMNRTVLAGVAAFVVVAFSARVSYGDELTQADLEQAMREAETEYDTAVSAKDTGQVQRNVQPTQPLGNQLERKKTEDTSLLEELAAQVDMLKNKVAVERATFLATQSPRQVKMRGAKTVYNYQDGAVFEVTAAIDHVTDVQLRAGESLTTPPTSGDTVRWNVGVMKSGPASQEVTHIIVKPLEDNVQTNLVITTDQHTYQLKLKSGEYHMPAVSWNYPDDHQAEILAALKKQESEEPTITPEHLRFTYKITGRKYSWRPLRVFDDGKKTFIQMPREMRVSEAPVFFIIEEGSDPILTNYRVKGDFYIVDRLFSKAELRVGTDCAVSIELDDGKNFFERLFE